MKNLLLTFAACLVITGNVFAGRDTNCETGIYPETIAHLMRNCKPFFDSDLNGVVHIVFSVDADNTIQLHRVESQNLFLENYAWCVLEGSEINSSCVNPGAVFEMDIVFRDTVHI